MNKRKGRKRPTAGRKGKPPGGGDFTLLQEHIGSRLKAMFDKVVEEPVPEKLRALLEELERKQPKR